MPETPRERRHQRTRDAILQAAVEIIREKGADKLSLRAVARRIDYSPAGLYEYFGSKDELVMAVCMDGNDRLLRGLRAVSQELPTVDYLAALGMTYVHFARENPELFTVMFGTMQGPQDLVRDAEFEENDAFAIVYFATRTGIEVGDLKAREGFGAFEMAYSLWAATHGMAVLQVTYLREYPADFPTIDAHAVRAFVMGLTHTNAPK